MFRDSKKMTNNNQPKITVHFVHHSIKKLDITISEGLTCRNVLEKCFSYMSKLVCPGNNEKTNLYAVKYLNIFGLKAHSDKNVWIPPSQLIKNLPEKELHYIFRVRYYPHKSKINYESSTTDVMKEYLFLQMVDDFLKGKLGRSSNLDDKKIFKLLSICFLMPNSCHLDSSEIVDKDFKGQEIRMWNLKEKISSAISKRLITQWFIDCFWICIALNDNIKTMKSEKANLGHHKNIFFSDLMEAEPHYWIEQYAATYNENKVSTKVTLKVNFSEFGTEPSLYFGEVFQFKLADIFDIENRTYNLDTKTKSVMIHTRIGAPKIVEFNEEGEADSFISMIQGFIMLYVNYDMYINNQLQTSDMKRRYDLRSFGPLNESTVERILSNPALEHTSRFLIHESTEQFDHFKVITRSGNVSKVMDIEFNKDRKFYLSKDGTLIKEFADHKELVFFLRNEYQTQCIPRDNPGSAEINQMFIVEELRPYGPEYGQGYLQNDSPGIYLREDLESKTNIPDRNPLIKKYQVILKGHEMMLVELQEDKPYIAEAFRGGIKDLLKLNRLKPDSFLKFYGSVWERKLCVLMEYTPHSDLLTFICKNPQTVAQTVSIMYQIVNVLGFMEISQIFHGNIRSRRFMVFSKDQSSSEINLKLGDSGISHYLDTCTMDDENNKEREPWLSPERRVNLKEITYESECYAVATTLCELIYRNDDFLHELTGDNLRVFKERKQIPKPSFIIGSEAVAENLSENSLTDKAKKVLEDIWDQVISKCWSEEPVERPCSSTLLQILHEIRAIAAEIEADTVFKLAKKLSYDIIDSADNVARRNVDQLKSIQECTDFLQNRFGNKYLNLKCLQLTSLKLGSGHYGEVWEARLREPQLSLQPGNRLQTWRKVAVKRFKNLSGYNTDAVFTKEVNLACGLDHPNIVKALYFCIDMATFGNSSGYSSIMLVMEYMDMKDLSSFAKSDIHANKTIVQAILLSICINIAEGMVYLSGKHIVHRDLAARNVLLSNCNGQIVAKVSDFGLARSMEENYRFYRFKKNNAIPIFWMPPEVLDTELDRQVFSTEGDVWSFGITLWEAMSKGTHPSKKIDQLYHNPHNLLNWYRKNNRLCRESYVCHNIYEVMSCCWKYEAQDRPAFVDLVQKLKALQGKQILNLP